MAKIDLSTITEAISEEQPCGPDLDMEFDMDFMTFSAEIDGNIPTRFFDWDPSSLDFEKYYGQIAGFLEKTRDIRLLVPLAKLRILQSDLAGFAETLDAIHRLLRDRWNDCHPQPGEFLDIGMGQLATLDDMPNVVLPLQHANFAQSRRVGPITLRKWQVAHGEVNPREGEDALDLEALTGALAEADPAELAGVRENLVTARDAVDGIRTVCIQEAGFDKAPPLDKLPKALAAAISMIETVVGSVDAGDEAETETEAVDHSTGTVPGTAAVRVPVGVITNREKAVEAMHAAEKYFALNEPSSPAPVLLREAQAASAKSFYELVNEFLPDSAASAAVGFGKDAWFDLHLSTLDARNPAPDYPTEDGGQVAAEDTGLGEDEIEEGVAETSGQASEGDTGDSDTGLAGESDEGSDGSEPTIVPDVAPATVENAVVSPPPATPKFVVNSRAEAVALLEKVVAYYRVAEPTSPVPLFVERAIDLSSKSFIELLGNVMPEGSLKVKEG